MHLHVYTRIYVHICVYTCTYNSLYFYIFISLYLSSCLSADQLPPIKLERRGTYRDIQRDAESYREIEREI